MKALSLTQPWATLVAIGAKRIETRSWYTSYRGPLAIHASNGYPRWAMSVCLEEPFRTALHDVPGPLAPAACRGLIVATCRLVDCRLIVETDLARTVNTNRRMLPPSEPERSFGDYAAGRYAWILDNVQALTEPIPAKGKLGLWEWAECHAPLTNCVR